MELLAISDLHLGHPVNREALQALPPHLEDWLILAGDVGETDEHLHFALKILTQRFARVIWVPGNHDLWTLPPRASANGATHEIKQQLRGEAKYQQLVTICRDYGVLTPEDPYVCWNGAGGPCLLAPLFTLYDYSFRPDDVPLESAVQWAEETDTVCVDEYLLHPTPYPTRSAWCEARCRYTEQRLQAAASPESPFIMINHFPLHPELAQLPSIPRFSLWCGTKHTMNWHTRFPTRAVVYGHLHIRGTRYLDGVRFDEVSLGYPRNWNQQRNVDYYLRKILPTPLPGATNDHQVTEREDQDQLPA
jgi:Icc-related predicted phosphoesterase